MKATPITQKASALKYMTFNSTLVDNSEKMYDSQKDGAGVSKAVKGMFNKKEEEPPTNENQEELNINPNTNPTDPKGDGEGDGNTTDNVIDENDEIIPEVGTNLENLTT